MQLLNNKRILLGVTGSIAAYKSAELIRRLRDAGAQVRVVMTEGAKAFVTPLTFQALSGFPVHENLLDKEAEAAMGHIELARWADVILIAPATANSLANLAHGKADELLHAVCLAADVPLAVAPAMNKHMWSDLATQQNLQLLVKRGVLVIGPDSGEQACGDVGQGRMIESEAIVTAVSQLFSVGSLTGKTVVITAGPTREAIDPVRYLSNHSSGKMGFAVANAAIEAGAKVILICGPVHLDTPDRVTRINIESAAEMESVVREQVAGADIFIATAAVADFRPVNIEPEKIKKTDAGINASDLNLTLEKTTDILAMVKVEHNKIFCVGFAAETQDLENYARAKLKQKNIEMIAANLVGHSATKTAGTFNSDDNELNVYWQDGEVKLALASKTKLARQLIELVAEQFSLYEKNMSNVVSLKNA